MKKRDLKGLNELAESRNRERVESGLTPLQVEILHVLDQNDSLRHVEVGDYVVNSRGFICVVCSVHHEHGPIKYLMGLDDNVVMEEFKGKMFVHPSEKIVEVDEYYKLDAAWEIVFYDQHGIERETIWYGTIDHALDEFGPRLAQVQINEPEHLPYRF